MKTFATTITLLFTLFISLQLSATDQSTSFAMINAVASDLTVECDGAGNLAELNAWLDNNGGAVAEANCGTLEWDHDYSFLSDYCGGTGSATITFTASDECTTETTIATFTIEDTTNPMITVEAQDLHLECSEIDQQLAIDSWLAANGGATASDHCATGALIWSHDYVPGEENTHCGLTGNMMVTFTATDDCGLFSITQASISSYDSTAPTITSQAKNLEVVCDGQGNMMDLNNWLVDNAGALATDECGDVNWTNDFIVLSEGCNTHTDVIFTATDECGNYAETTARFTIKEESFASQERLNAITKVWEVDLQQVQEGSIDLNIHSISEDEEVNIKIYTLGGQMVVNQLAANMTTWHSQLSLTAGTYFVVVESNTGKKETFKQVVF